MIKKGEPWGHAPSGPADQVVDGDDVALARAVARAPHPRLWFRPTEGSDFAKSVGIAVGAHPERATAELPCDILTGRLDDREVVAVNMIVVGAAPDRQVWRSRDARLRVHVDGRELHDGPATAVVIANGQYLRGADVVPRGHPGDARVEVHVYTLGRGERRAMRSRLATGRHVPHPRIAVASGRRVVVEGANAPIPVEIDGARAGSAGRLEIEVTPGAFSLLV
ncbi:MAG: hypothetical protein WEB19_01310 [Acidimicrobiia bacterium]